ncbi:efflux transporter outer membrane subunit [Sphingomonas sanguinis]|uniref:Efflux transporter outer membrane subunit n=1 Tax=Sphingomonas sanguinis TaxID=33051 RepID=A0ABU5LKG8_9SPHN|nr:efflux transporter outer membrane subunit [Sphingomonas sanguinis]MDZ7280423.1 efflux transporter outer membrane subunit [Sphingomonas sanguinis]
MRRMSWPILALVLGGCAVGPDFHTPLAPNASGYTPATLPAQTEATPVAGGKAQRFRWGGVVSDRWWTRFGSPALDALEADALAHNPDVESAKAALRAARQTYLAQRGTLFPSVSANGQVERQKNANVLQSPLNDNSDIFTLYTLGATASYTPDLFGGIRRGVEGAKAQAEAQRFQTEAAYLTVTTNVANTTITLASLDRQIAMTGQVIEADRRYLTIVQAQLRLGAASGADVAAAQLALSQAEAALPALAKQQAQARDFLAVLTGRYPAEHFAAPDLDALHLPAELPVSLPSELVAQRPDIRAAEANLHYASAQVGVAIAARLPSFSITGTAGGTSTGLSTLFRNGNPFWSLTGGLLQPIFEGGTLLKRQRAAEATLDQAKAQYRSTVLSAMQNVADVVQGVSADAQALRAAAQADAAARRALDIAQAQARLGQVSDAATLNLQAAWLGTQGALVQARAQRLTDSVLLYQALGGGWNERHYQDR